MLLLEQELTSRLRTVFEQTPQTPRLWEGVRKLPHGKPLKRISRFASAKNRMSIPVEGGIEKNLCYLLEWDTQVIAYRTQPLTVSLGAAGSYTPDFVVMKGDGTVEIKECKFSGELERESVSDKLAIASCVFENQGIPFRIVTEEKFVGPEFELIKRLYPASHFPFASDHIQLGMELLRKNGPSLTFIQAKSLFANNQLLSHFVEWAMFHRHLVFAVHEGLSPSLKLEVGDAQQE